MENSWLIQVLKTFSIPENKKFGEFINSPYFNKNIHVIQLYNFLIPYLPETAITADKKKIFVKLFHNEKYNDEKMRNIMSDLLRLTELYLAQLKYESDSFSVHKNLIEELASRELENVLESNIKRSQKLILEAEVKDDQFYSRQYQLKRVQRKIYESKVPYGRQQKYFESLQSEMDSLVISFLIRMLKYYCLITIEEKRMFMKFEKKYYSEVMGYLEHNVEQFKTVPAIQIYYNLLLLNGKSNNSKQFADIQNLLNRNREFITADDIKFAHVQLHNYCLNKRTGLESEFNPHCFRLMKDMISGGSFPVNGKYMTDHIFICLANAALEAGEYKWVEKFIDDYKSRLSPRSRINTTNYIKAVLNYYRCNYPEAIRQLALIKIGDYYFYLRTHNYMLKCYYKMGRTEQVHTMIDKFKRTLSRNKTIPEGIKIKFYNYVNYLDLLCNIKANQSTVTPDEFIKKLNACKEIENKDWLLKTAGELTA